MTPLEIGQLIAACGESNCHQCAMLKAGKVGLAVPKEVQDTAAIMVKDHSGSMAQNGKAAAALDASNDILDQIKRQCVPGHNITYSEITFGPVAVVKKFVDPRDIPRAWHYPTPGGTPLYDALGQGIELGREAIRLNPRVCPFLYMFTDGENAWNSKQRWNPDSLKIAVAQCLAEGNWTISMVCADSEAYSFAQYVGIPEGNIMFCENTGKGVAAASRRVSDSTSSLLAARAAGTLRGSNSFFRL